MSMPNIVEVKYERTAKSTNTAAQYLLVKAPPAFGKTADDVYDDGLKLIYRK